MKKLIILLAFIAIAFSIESNAQNVKREGNNFTVEKTLHSSSDILTQYTYIIKDIVYPIWITKNGRCYIVRTSKDGNEYRQYLPKDICMEICHEMNIEYKE